jgi:hypothetical protein
MVQPKRYKKCKQFKEMVLAEINIEIDDINRWWDHVNSIMVETGKEILGESSGKVWVNNKET